MKQELQFYSGNQDGQSDRRRTRSRSHSRSRRNGRDNDRSRSPRRRSPRGRGGRTTIKQDKDNLKYRWEKTIFVSNIPYDVSWRELKDLFREKVGDQAVTYCEIFEKDGKSMGVGALELKTVKDAERAVQLMHQYDINGRKLSVRIDGEGYKTKQAKDASQDAPSKHHDRMESSLSPVRGSSNANLMSSLMPQLSADAATLALSNNLLGLLGLSNPLATTSTLSGLLGSTNAAASLPTPLLNQLAAQLKVEGPVTNRIFVASLDYKVDETKLKEVYSLAGQITSASLFRDRTGRSRGMAVVEYETPFEALNAVSMFNNQQLLERQMTVRFDSKPPTKEEEAASQQAKLPSGLKSIGNSLGMTLLGNGSLPASTVANPVAAGNNALNLGVITALAGLNSSQTGDFGLNINQNGLGLLGNFANNGSGNGQSNGSNNNNRSSGSNNTISKIFVKNIPFSWDERKLKEKFRQAGHIEYAEIKMRDGKSRGCGMIRFNNPDQAEKAVELFNGSRFEGRALEVKLDLF